MALKLDGYPVPTPPCLTLEQEREWHNSIAGQAEKQERHWRSMARRVAQYRRTQAYAMAVTAKWLAAHHREAARQCGKAILAGQDS
jgi:hypothetical protein